MSHALHSIHTNSPDTTDQYYMMLAISEAKKGIYITRPNPTVGCILVKDNQIIGQGHTSPAGGNHGEINALANAKQQGNTDKISGATAYVTLEPCSHYGRTPPCALALHKANIARVVVAGLDPNPQVAGRGIQMLQQANIEVSVFAQGSSIHQQVEDINKGFLKAMRTGMPYVRLKIATSLDGRTAMHTGESKWITSAEAREDVQHYRALSGAIITGSQTVIDDNPKLSVRSSYLGVPVTSIVQPIVAVLDRRHRLHQLDSSSDKADYHLCQQPNTLFWDDTSANSLSHLLSNLVEQHKCYDVMIEAGAKVSGAFMQARLVDEVIMYQAPCLLGTKSKPMFDFSINQLSEQHRLYLLSHEQVGIDMKLVFACR